MKGKIYLKYSIALFTIVQLSCFALLGFWIFWFVSNDVIYTNLANLINPDLMLRNNGTDLFIYGLLLILLISTGLIFIFVRLIRQTAVNRIYDGFIANVTHELKSPLASIQLGIETLQRHQLTKEKYIEFLSRLADDTQRLNKLIGSILEISILDNKGDFFEPELLPADDTVRNLVKEIYNQFRLNENNIAIEGCTECHIKIDPSGLATVLNNLTDNSIKYSDPPVRINIKLEHNKKKFIIIFSDEGIGISDKERKAVFNKFTRIKRPDSPSVKGTGLGLYWCREILKIHNGKISIQKKPQTSGTSFKIELPAEKKLSGLSAGGLQNFG